MPVTILTLPVLLLLLYHHSRRTWAVVGARRRSGGRDRRVGGWAEKKRRYLLPFHRSVPVSNWISCCVSHNCSRVLFVLSHPLFLALLHLHHAHTGPQRGWSRCARARIATRDFAYVAANAAKNSAPGLQTLARPGRFEIPLKRLLSFRGKRWISQGGILGPVSLYTVNGRIYSLLEI